MIAGSDQREQTLRSQRSFALAARENCSSRSHRDNRVNFSRRALIGRRQIGLGAEPHIGRTRAASGPFWPSTTSTMRVCLSLSPSISCRFRSETGRPSLFAVLKCRGRCLDQGSMPVRRYSMSFLDHRSQRFRGSCTEKVTVKSGSVTTSFVERRR